MCIGHQLRYVIGLPDTKMCRRAKHGLRGSHASNREVVVAREGRWTAYGIVGACILLPLLSVGLYMTFMDYNYHALLEKYPWQLLDQQKMPNSGWTAGNSTLLEEKNVPSVTAPTQLSAADQSTSPSIIQADQYQHDSNANPARVSIPLIEQNGVGKTPNSERNLGCSALGQYTSEQYWKSKQRNERSLGEPIMIVKNPSLQQLLISVPGCGKFYFKMSCRPVLTYFWGNQAWPEIVAHELDLSLGYNLTYPNVGMILPLKVFGHGTRKAGIQQRCVHRYNDEAVLVGSIMRSAGFKEEQPAWYKKQCNSKNLQFMKELFKLSIFDYLLLNNDRHMTKNWFRDGDHIVAADNGAWSLNNDTNLCVRSVNLKEMLYPIRVLRKKTDMCPALTNSTSLICGLTRLLNQTETVKSFVHSSWRGKRNFEDALSTDRWFIRGPSLLGKIGEKGATQLGKILSRNVATCQKQIENLGINSKSQVHTAEIIRFISNEIEQRYLLAQKTIRGCLEG